MIAGRTKRQIREAVGFNVLGSRYIVSTSTTTGTTTTLVDAALQGSDKSGGWVIFRSGTDDGTIVRVTSDSGSGTLTFTPAINADSVDSGDAYELWPDRYDPKMLHSFMDDAILDVTGRVFDPEEDLSLHMYSDRLRYDVPTQFKMINRLEERVSVRDVEVAGTSAVWGTINSNVTATIDSEVQIRGGSLKMVIATAASAGDDLATQTISSIDISRQTHLTFWIRSTKTLAAGDISIILSDAGGVEETLTIEAVGTADTWQFQRLTLASAESDTAIVTIVVDYTVDGGGYTLWVEDFRAEDNDSGDWQRINPNRWGLDVQARDIVFKSRPRYRLLKITGGDNPALLSAETTTSEVDDFYIIAYTTAAVLGALSDGSTDASRRLGQWEQRLALAKGGFPPLINVRKLS